MTTNGIHHITAIAGPANRNVAFYTQRLGLRLVKKTVNFDDPGSYHLYYGDRTGSPGTILTFFPWEKAAPGHAGSGELQETAFRVPEAALAFWAERLADLSPEHDTRFGTALLRFRDPDGMRLALVGVPGIDAEPAWITAGIDPAYAIRGVHGVTLVLDSTGATGAVLSDVFGFMEAGQDGDTTRFKAEGVAVGGIVDLQRSVRPVTARPGAGSVHHLAFRAADDAAQAAMADTLLAAHGLRATEQRDRDYFRSIYFREPGGVLFEIATDSPGFAVDEPEASLGSALKLPAGLRPFRAQIEARLPALD